MKTVEEKYGVPTFETCKKLAKYWKEETLFITYFNNENILTVDSSKNDYYGDYNYYYAPQIHELLEVLPKELIFSDEVYRLHYSINKNFEAYSYNNGNHAYNTDFIFIIENGNVAECLAQIYLTLKEKELI